MSFTLGDLLKEVYLEIGEMEVSVATGGTTLTVLDTKLSGRGIQDIDYKDGFLAIFEAGAVAPEDEYQRIVSSIDDGTKLTFTVDTAFSTAPAIDDTYGYARATYPLYQGIEQINVALRMLKDIHLVDTTTLDSTSGTTEYAALVAWKRRRPTMIDYQGTTGTPTTDNDWIRIFDWEFVPSLPGTTGKIIFRHEIPSGRDIRIWYVDRHPRVSIFSDVISETIPPELAIRATILKLAQWNLRRTGVDDDDARDFRNDARREYAIAQLEYPVWKPRKELGGLIVNDAFENVREGE